MDHNKLIASSRFALFAFWLIILCFYLPNSSNAASSDTIQQGESLSGSKTLVSAGAIFELGFFRPSGSSNYYLGIWYNNISVQTVVWASKSIHFLTSSTLSLTVNDNGNIVILDGKDSYTLANVTSREKVSAVLLDSGNFILRDKNSNILWESFDYPTDTWLPGMKLGYDRTKGKSWSLANSRYVGEPVLVNLTMFLDPEESKQLLITKDGTQYWTSGRWTGQIFSLIPEMSSFFSEHNMSFVEGQNTSFFTFQPNNRDIISRFVLHESGHLKLYRRSEGSQDWTSSWSQPGTQCQVYDFCGVFYTCSDNQFPVCTCLPGYVPRSPKNWNKSDLSRGCVRKAHLQCELNTTKNSYIGDKFSKLSNFSLPDHPYPLKVPNAEECESACFTNCSCVAYSFDGDTGCSIWNNGLVNVREGLGKDFYLKLASSELVAGDTSNENGSSGRKQLQAIIIAVIIPLIVITSIAIFCRAWIKKHRRKGEDLLSYDFDINQEGPKSVHAESRKHKKGGKKEVELPLFSFSGVAAATDNFSVANKLGEGGFGPVYKGNLPKGCEIAVKRLSKRSGQGWEELKNEAVLIAKLQHKNLVKLLGCCVDRNENILIYEYLPNKSLDYFLFDPMNNGILDWEMRIHIVEGIAQGLLYLHQYSRVQIIHRDLKASNILLDKEMNPKISDFGLARIFGGKGSQATNRIVGTYGYMSPEYALEGVFSTKSDVFSFGVLLLEILSGKRNTGFYRLDSLDLLGYAWDLWRSNVALELMDPGSGDNFSPVLSLKLINIALLCVQESAADRLNMSEVVLMLSNDQMTLPSPKRPAFSNMRSLVNVDSSTSTPENFTVNDLTLSIVEAR